MNYKRIGIMGGTFDPIHIGHLIFAEEARAAMDLDQVLFIPAGRPPHKQKQKTTNPNQRYQMVSLSIQNNPHFSASDMEVVKNAYSYSYDTMVELKGIYPNTRLFFIMGEDSILSIDSWHRSREFLEMVDVIVIKRKLDNINQLLIKISQLEKEGYAIHLLKTPYLEISSTMIRNRVKHNKSIKYFVPKIVEDYIYQNQLYGEVYDGI